MDTNTVQSQNEKILEHLQTGQGISPLQAVGAPFFTCYLSARIRDLRDAGYVIESRRRNGEKNWTYYLVDVSQEVS